MDLKLAVSKIYDHLESDNIEGAVMACLRVARASKDYLNTIIFLRELYPSKNEVARALYDDAQHLTEEAQKFVWEKALDRWLEVHTMNFSFPSNADDGKERTVLKIAAGEIEPELKQWEAAIIDLTPPAGMTAFDTAAFHHSSSSEKANIRLRITALNTIKSRLKTRCLNYAIQIESQLALQHRNQSILWNVQNEVNNYFKDRSDDVFEKLQKASQLASSTHNEDAALLLTEVRRALKGAADHFYPASSAKVTCSDGKERVLGDEQYMNRFEEYLASRFATSTAKELAVAELKLLAAFMRRLNDLASKGVHARVTYREARQGLVGLYMFLGNLVQDELLVPS